jgi:hypothetical protein
MKKPKEEKEKNIDLMIIFKYMKVIIEINYW